MKLLWMTPLLVLMTACQQQAPEPPQTKDQAVQVKACTKDLKVCEDGQTVGRDANNQCEFFACPPPREVTACPDDMKQCPDGSFVYRDQSKHCAFKPCPGSTAEPSKNTTEPMMCTQEVRQCPDGSYVGRDSLNGCAFKPCPDLKDSDNNKF